ncbi:MAG: outer membrane protein transport protein [Halofilum sp. (in: g-proteobacteria)]|nr:outer membrane protein transport protein [Halofilum sp. (in: g-proteobacteria)]
MQLTHAAASADRARLDSSVKITGDDRSFGFDLSLLYEFDSDTRVGLSWREGVDYTLEGDVTFDESSSCAADPRCDGATTDGAIQANVELPDIITLSGTHGIGDDWRVDADIAWYEWDSIQQLRIERPNGQEVSTLDLEYENTVRYAVGGTYTGLDSTTLRAGVAYDESPISSPETTTPAGTGR